MPGRQSIIKVPSPEVQGPDSYIEFQRLTWGERRQVRQDVQVLLDEPLMEYFQTFLMSHLKGWNWVDSQGEPLPLPVTEEDLVKLLDLELEFLFETATRAVRGELLLDETEKKP